MVKCWHHIITQWYLNMYHGMYMVVQGISKNATIHDRNRGIIVV